MKTIKAAALINSRDSRPWYDYLGIGFSVVCLIHCLLLPLTIMFAPFIASWLLADQLFHTYLLAFILPLAVLAFFFGWQRHQSNQVLVFGLSGVLLISMAAMQAAWLDHGLFSAGMEKILTSLGGFMLILGHLLNLRRSRSTTAATIIRQP